MPELQLETVGPFGDCAVLRVAGEIDVYTAPELRERLAELVDSGVRRVVLDTSGVTFLDSTGLGVLIGSRKRFRAHDGSLALVADQQRIVRLLELTGLIGIFPPHATVAEAISADPRWCAVA